MAFTYIHSLFYSYRADLHGSSPVYLTYMPQNTVYKRLICIDVTLDMEKVRVGSSVHQAALSDTQLTQAEILAVTHRKQMLAMGVDVRTIDISQEYQKGEKCLWNIQAQTALKTNIKYPYVLISAIHNSLKGYKGIYRYFYYSYTICRYCTPQLSYNKQ